MRRKPIERTRSRAARLRTEPRSEPNRARTPTGPGVALQRTIGNRAVRELLGSGRPPPSAARERSHDAPARSSRDAETAGYLTDEERGFDGLERGPLILGNQGPDSPEATDAGPDAPETVADDRRDEPTEADRDSTCEIDAEATVHAPDGTDDSRTTIGVCETIRFTLGGRAADWSASSGWPRAREDRREFLWAAPDRAGTQTITATLPDAEERCRIRMDVVEPDRVEMDRRETLDLSAGDAGAGMSLRVRLSPRNVNFGWVEIREESGPASNVTGYFANRQATGMDLDHHANPDFARVEWNNDVCCDVAAIFGNAVTPPYIDGGFDWRIPYSYRCAPSTGGGRVFTHVRQRFRIDDAGTVTVSKGGASVTRSP